MKIIMMVILMLERAVIYTMEFTAKTYLYEFPTTNANVVRKVQSDLGGSTEEPCKK